MIVRSLVQTVAPRVFRSRLAAQTLFGVKLRDPVDGHYYFDVTTFVLARYLEGRIDSTQCVLDMGTGSSATLGLYLSHRFGCRVLAVDINPTLLALAQQSVQRNNLDVHLVRSDFFASVDESFDAVVFNPPYVKRASGEQRKLTEATRTQWDGGDDGTEVIQAFLDAVAALPHRVQVFMGVNRWHVGRERHEQLFETREPLKLDSICEHPWLPVNVYSFQNIPQAAKTPVKLCHALRGQLATSGL